MNQRPLGPEPSVLPLHHTPILLSKIYNSIKFKFLKAYKSPKNKAINGLVHNHNMILRDKNFIKHKLKLCFDIFVKKFVLC